MSPVWFVVEMTMGQRTLVGCLSTDMLFLQCEVNSSINALWANRLYLGLLQRSH